MWDHALCFSVGVKVTAVWWETPWEKNAWQWKGTWKSMLDCRSRQGSLWFVVVGKDTKETSSLNKWKCLTGWREGSRGEDKVDDLRRRWYKRGGKQTIMRRLQCAIGGKLENRQWNGSGSSCQRLKEMVAEDNSEHDGVKKLYFQTTAKSRSKRQLEQNSY